MARRNLDWVVGWWTDVYVGPAVNAQVILPLISDTNLEQLEDDCIVERVVGQYMLWSDSDDLTALIHARLCVRPEDVDGAGPFAASIKTFGMADEQFMWHKVHMLAPKTRNLGPDVHPEWSHIDVRVNRKLEGLDRLCLIFEPAHEVVSNATTQPNWFWAAWIRVLVKS